MVGFVLPEKDCTHPTTLQLSSGRLTRVKPLRFSKGESTMTEVHCALVASELGISEVRIGLAVCRMGQ